MFKKIKLPKDKEIKKCFIFEDEALFIFDDKPKDLRKNKLRGWF